MNERELRQALWDVPGDELARERARRLVQAAYRTQRPAAPRARTRSRWIGAAVAACLVAVLATVSATHAPTDALARWIRDTVGIGEPDARPALGRLPHGGRLLVTAGGNAWVVAPDGGKRRLGRYDGASWSPRGLFAVAWRGRDLTALEPNGDVRWSLRGSEVVRAASWAPGDGYRIAYVAGAELRVVNGDGTGDRRYAGARGGIAPAWRPRAAHVLAYADPTGRVRVAAVDLRGELWHTARVQGIRALVWSPDGERLLVLAARRAILLDRDGAVLADRALPADLRGLRAAWSSRGELALVRRDAMATRSEVVLFDPVSGRGRVLFTAPGTLGPVTWSPDGRLLLVSWPDADQWLFLAPRQRRGPVRAVADVAAQFSPGAVRARFPTRVEWMAGPSP